MSEEKLKEIKDSIDFQLRVCELNKYEPDMIIEEKELYDYAVNLQQENKQLKERINNADEFCDRYMGCKLELFDMYELLNKIREILEGEENE